MEHPESLQDNSADLDGDMLYNEIKRIIGADLIHKLEDPMSDPTDNMTFIKGVLDTLLKSD